MRDMEDILAGLDKDVETIVRTIEAKPHRIYIRYLLTKKYSPRWIKGELWRLALSAPHEKHMATYYMTIIDPLVKKYGLGYIYGQYKSRILNSGSKEVRDKTPLAYEVLKFSIDVAGTADTELKFMLFLNELGVMELWQAELTKHYGSFRNAPRLPDGRAVLQGDAAVYAGYEKILASDHRYKIDKMLLEHVSPARISAYCKGKLAMPASEEDVRQYQKFFFNTQLYEYEQLLDTLIAEKRSMQAYLELLNKNTEISSGEKTVLATQLSARIKDLEDNIRDISARHSDVAGVVAANDEMDYESMFADIVDASYRRFKNLDKYNDRDVVDLLFKVTRTMGYAFDKAHEAKNIKGSDQNSKSELLRMYHKGADDFYRRQRDLDDELGNLGSDYLLGVDEIAPGEILGAENVQTNEIKKDGD